MSDDDLIRRGDALAAVQGLEYSCNAEEDIAALPAVTGGAAALLRDVPRYQTLSGNMLPEDAVLAALSRALILKGGDAFDQAVPIDARPATSPGVTAGAIQKGASDDRTDPMQELIDAYEDIMDYGIVFAKREQQDRLKAAKEALK